MCRGCNPVVSYAGARQTAVTFADQLQSASGLWGHISHPLRKPPSQSVGHQQSPAGNSSAPDAAAAAEASAEQSGGHQKNAAVARSGSQQSILDSGHCYRWVVVHDEHANDEYAICVECLEFSCDVLDLTQTGALR